MKPNNFCDLERLLTKATELLVESEAELAILEAHLIQREAALAHLWDEVCLRRRGRTVGGYLDKTIKQKVP
ncbi:MAG: hypothetical protein HY267_04285 [Deltaproteobacteria bacterium]|nr:hypothetical protein [Deltaproteobacteria bacterium]